MKTLPLIFAILFTQIFASAQQLFTENFSYTNSQALSSNNWTIASGSTSPIVTSSGLTYSGYVLSNIGNAAALNTSGQGVVRDGVTNINSGNIYTSFMINVSAASTSGDYFFSLLPQGAAGLNTSFGRVYAKLSSTGYYKLGIQKFNETVAYGNDSFAIGATILVVAKYKFAASSGNDSCMIYGFSSGVPSTEPTTPSAVTTSSIASPSSGFGRYALRFGTSSPTLIIDGIRSGQTWADVNSPTTNPVQAVSSPTFTSNSGTIATITWNKPASFIGTTMTTLVFVKSASAITTGTPTNSLNSYTANPNFSTATSSFQNDANAKCVFKDTTNTITVSGLTQGTTYYASIYIVRNSDTVYSLPITVNGTMPVTSPNPITNITYTSTGQTTATINFTKPTGYNNATNTMVLFIKPSSSIIQGNPIADPNNFIANTNYTGISTKFENDTTAHCIFVGDTNFVSITGLSPATNYYILGYAINNPDSSYSTPTTGTGRTNSPNPQAVTTLTFTATGTTNANITWNKGSNYYNSLFTTLVFVKQSPPNITAGTPNRNPNTIADNIIFASGSSYQNDANAYCVFKGDTNTVSISGLTAGTNYSILVYVVRDIDSLYSSSTTGIGATQAAPPADVTGVTFSALTSTSARVAWTLPTGFNPGTSRVLVLVKQGSSIVAGTPTHAINFYTANTVFGNGTSYQNDPSAFCVYRGTLSNVTITNLNTSGTYYVLVYIVRQADSVYSAGATASGTTQSPLDVTNVAVTGISTTAAAITWTRPTNYSNAGYTTLVFFKQASAVLAGTPSSGVNSYTANASFATGSFYQNDASAWCVYKGDSSSVNVSNINNSTPYYVLIYVVRDADSAYSINGATASGSALATPPPAPTDVNGVGFTGTSTISAKITWIKPSGYTNPTFTTLVFVKQGATILSGTPTKTVTYYTANSSFGLGNGFQNDPSARCVYKGDTDFVNISNINNSAPYYVLIYIVRDYDSVYSSPGATTTGSALATPPPPTDASAITFTGISTTAAKVSWTRPTAYSISSYTTLVFVKQSSIINSGTPSKSVTFYNANSSFGLGNSFQNDASARCVFKGDSDFVNITNINNSAPYYVLVYIVRDADSVYSSTTGATGSGSALASPPPPPTDVNGVTFTGLSTTAAKISWTKPSSYDNNILTTLVFVKKLATINSGTPSRSVNTITANPFFGLGSTYQNDASAKCVFKGDTNFINIGNITNDASYYLLIYVVRDFDSTYSINGAIGNGNALPTPPIPPYYNIGQINTSNALTGNADSLNVRVGLRGIVYGFNERNLGVEFLLRDNTGGVTISSPSSSFGYSVLEGDSIEVQGTISSNRGLINVTALDTLKILGTGKQIKIPTIVSKLNEASENNLVRVNALKFITTPTGGVWQSNTAISCIKVGSSPIDTIILRILSSSAIVGQPLPSTGLFSVIGIGGQASSSAISPYSFDGYYILPRKVSDIILVDTFSKFTLLSPTNHSGILVTDSFSINKFTWTSSSVNFGFDFVKYVFQLDTITGNFTTPKFIVQSNNLGVDTFLNIQNITLATIVNAKNIPFYGKWRVVASATSLLPSVKISDSIFSINITIGNFNGINEISQQHSIHIYPNPTTQFVNILCDESLKSITVFDLIGKEIIYQTSSSNTIDVSSLSKGVYLLKVNTEKAQHVQRIIIE